MISQMFWVAGEQGFLHYSIPVNYVLNLGDLCSTGYTLLFWYEMNCVILYGRLPKDSLRTVIDIPIAILTFCNIISIKTHWIFYINSDNRYVRGDFYWIQVVCTYIYFALAVGIDIHGLFHGSAMKKKLYRKLLFYSFIPILGGVMQVTVGTFPFSVATMLGSQLFLYINMLSTKIRTDELTSLNNRASCDEKIEKYIETAEHDPFYLYLLDINDFKSINDTYGHNCGDEALIIVSHALRSVANRYDRFAGRYGGAEFLAIIKRKNIPFPIMFHKDVNALIEERMRQHKKPFTITIATGYTLCYAPDISRHDLVEKADSELYQIKAQMKKSKKKR